MIDQQLYFYYRSLSLQTSQIIISVFLRGAKLLISFYESD